MCRDISGSRLFRFWAKQIEEQTPNMPDNAQISLTAKWGSGVTKPERYEAIPGTDMFRRIPASYSEPNLISGLTFGQMREIVGILERAAAQPINIIQAEVR